MIYSYPQNDTEVCLCLIQSCQKCFSWNRSTVLLDLIDLINPNCILGQYIRCTVRIDSSESKYLLTVPVDSLDTISNTFDSIDLIDPNCILGTISKMYGTNRLIWIKIFFTGTSRFFLVQFQISNLMFRSHRIIHKVFLKNIWYRLTHTDRDVFQ